MVEGVTYSGVPVPSACDRSADNSAKIEDGPEDTDVLALIVLGGISHHEGALGGPQQTCTDSEDSSCRDDEWARIGMDIHSTRM